MCAKPTPRSSAPSIDSGGRVLAEFWAPWCVQCGPMAGVVERVAETLPEDVAVLKVSVEDASVADAYSVSALPAVTLLRLRPRREVDQRLQARARADRGAPATPLLSDASTMSGRPVTLMALIDKAKEGAK